MPFGTPNPCSTSPFSPCKRLLHSSARRSNRKPLKDKATSTLPPPRLDYKSIIENQEYHAQNIKNRNIRRAKHLVQEVAQSHSQRNALLAAVNKARHDQNLLGDRVRNAKTPGERAAIVQEAKAIKDFLAIEEPLERGEARNLLELGLRVPNITHPEAPIGHEKNAKVLSYHGPERLEANVERDHWHVAKQLNLVDFDAAAVTTGSAWYFLKGAAALLEQALVNYALSVAIKYGYTPVSTPDVIKSDIASRCGFSPRDEPDHSGKSVQHFYHLEGTSNNLVLAGTAEIPLAGMFVQRTFIEGELPARVVAVGHAFRSEAGSRGAEARGLYRVHQFTKVELFSVTEGNKSDEMMEEIRKIQIEMFEGLGFPFRVLDMPTEELGHAAYRKYDIEAWMPGRGVWGEISSASNCLDFQARRLHILYRPVQSTTSSGILNAESPKGHPFAHTLNGTAAAIPRLIVALLENGARLNEASQTIGISLPSTLRRFWLGGDSLGPYARITWFDPPSVPSRG